jgi:hypothetical protein
MKAPIKPHRPFGRLPQCNKANRLRRRALGQWAPQPVAVRNSPLTRYSLAETEWKEGL